MKVVIIATCLLLGLVSCQLDCDLPTDSDIANVIGLTFQSEPEITLRNVRHVCRAFSEEKEAATDLSHFSRSTPVVVFNNTSMS